jgi:hypothetical protein
LKTIFRRFGQNRSIIYTKTAFFATEQELALAKNMREDYNSGTEYSAAIKYFCDFEAFWRNNNLDE